MLHPSRDPHEKANFRGSSGSAASWRQHCCSPARSRPCVRQELALQSRLAGSALLLPCRGPYAIGFRPAQMQLCVIWISRHLLAWTRLSTCKAERGLWLHCSLPALHCLSSCRKLQGAVWAALVGCRRAFAGLIALLVACGGKVWECSTLKIRMLR